MDISAIDPEELILSHSRLVCTPSHFSSCDKYVSRVYTDVQEWKRLYDP